MGNHQIRAKEMFLFEENINLYFKMMRDKNDVSNPENTEHYELQDIETWIEKWWEIKIFKYWDIINICHLILFY